MILVPSMVTHYKGDASPVDIGKVKIEIPQIELPPLDFSQPPGRQIAAFRRARKSAEPERRPA